MARIKRTITKNSARRQNVRTSRRLRKKSKQVELKTYEGGSRRESGSLRSVRKSSLGEHKRKMLEQMPLPKTTTSKANTSGTRE